MKVILFAGIAGISVTPCLGQTNAFDSLAAHDSVNSVNFVFQEISRDIGLNQFTPGADSCASLGISFEQPFKIRAVLEYNRSRLWHFRTLQPIDTAIQNIGITTTLSPHGPAQLKTMNIFCSAKNDSTGPALSISRMSDTRLVPPDTTKKFLIYSFRRSAFPCLDSPAKMQEQRAFTYPAWYMKREPVRNYPELSMFHYGGSVKIPTNESVRVMGIMQNYWHLLYPPEVEYGGPKKEIREQTEKPEKKRKPIITIRPIR